MFTDKTETPENQKCSVRPESTSENKIEDYLNSEKDKQQLVTEKRIISIESEPSEKNDEEKEEENISDLIDIVEQKEQYRTDKHFVQKQPRTKTEEYFGGCNCL